MSKAKTKQRPKIKHVHPGEILRDELEARKMKHYELAEIAGWSPAYLSHIMTGRRGISPEAALTLERVLGMDADVWLRMQANYELDQVREKRDGKTK